MPPVQALGRTLTFALLGLWTAAVAAMVHSYVVGGMARAGSYGNKPGHLTVALAFSAVELVLFLFLAVVGSSGRRPPTMGLMIARAVVAAAIALALAVMWLPFTFHQGGILAAHVLWLLVVSLVLLAGGVAGGAVVLWLRWVRPRPERVGS